jgi:chromate reductase
MNSPITILGIAGSLRKQSCNRGLLRAARELAPEGVTLETFEIHAIPLYNQDDDTDQTRPGIVVDLKARIRAADAILFATPEYNYSIPGGLKNAIDWASRPSGQGAWTGKPVAVMGASPGAQGTSRAQYHLRQCFVFLDMHAVNKPEVMIGMSGQRFDEHGNLTDERSRQAVQDLVAALAALTRRMK